MNIWTFSRLDNDVWLYYWSYFRTNSVLEKRKLMKLWVRLNLLFKKSKIVQFSPHTPDRCTSSHPRCASKIWGGGVSEVRFKKTRLLHLGNVKKLPHPQFFTKRAWKFINSMDLKSFLKPFWTKFENLGSKSQISNTRCLSKIRWQKGQL